HLAIHSFPTRRSSDLRRRRGGRQSRGGVRTPVRDRSERTRRRGGKYRAYRARGARLAGWFWAPGVLWQLDARRGPAFATAGSAQDRKSTRLNSSHLVI